MTSRSLVGEFEAHLLRQFVEPYRLCLDAKSEPVVGQHDHVRHQEKTKVSGTDYQNRFLTPLFRSSLAYASGSISGGADSLRQELERGRISLAAHVDK